MTADGGQRPFQRLPGLSVGESNRSAEAFRGLRWKDAKPATHQAAALVRRLPVSSWKADFIPDENYAASAL